eukprot:TRINITY_DN14376_c0_g1_i4.p1 TRINITY_DN14376_c0_g1~~TRINITY_DN14376_c0_g1_i4.p1  ORF type:complete len:532 (-),score=94.58 TRINITY_DN14376_c0_g1_i4:263-1795(-)
MDAEYGRIFLLNYQCAPLPQCLAASGAGSSGVCNGVSLQAGAGASAAVCTAGAALSVVAAGCGAASAATAGSAAAPLSPRAAAGANGARAGGATAANVSSGAAGSSSSSFRLAPPPAPARPLSVGNWNAGHDAVVVIDSLKDPSAADSAGTPRQPRRGGAADPNTPEQHGGEDDFDCLLPAGDDVAGTPCRGSVKFATDIDGADSDEDVEPAPSVLPAAVESSPSKSAATGAGASACDELDSPRHEALRPTVEPGGLVRPSGQASNNRQAAEDVLTAADADVWNAAAHSTPDAAAALDAHVSSVLDTFFQDERLWKQVIAEVNSVTAKSQRNGDLSHRSRAAKGRFRVQVPRPYPGVQFRKTKCLEDRHQRYARQGAIVSGILEDDGEWLRITDTDFLPTRVGAIHILEPLDDGAAKALGRSSAGAPTQSAPLAPLSPQSQRQGQVSGRERMLAAPPAASTSPLPPVHGSEEDELRAATIQSLHQSLRGNGLAGLDVDRICSDAINPFSD